jgi:hypothetical protein
LIAITKFRAAHWLQTSLWFWPLVCIGAGLALSVISVTMDRAFDGTLIPRALTGGPDAALEILSTVAGSMVSLTALVLTVVLGGDSTRDTAVWRQSDPQGIGASRAATVTKMPKR